MVSGTVRKVDLKERTAVIETGEGEVHVRFSPATNFEVAELSTMGTTRGELQDIEIGFLVQFDLADRHEDGAYHCTDLVCIS